MGGKTLQRSPFPLGLQTIQRIQLLQSKSNDMNPAKLQYHHRGRISRRPYLPILLPSSSNAANQIAAILAEINRAGTKFADSRKKVRGGRGARTFPPKEMRSTSIDTTEPPESPITAADKPPQPKKRNWPSPASQPLSPTHRPLSFSLETVPLPPLLLLPPPALLGVLGLPL